MPKDNEIRTIIGLLAFFLALILVVGALMLGLSLNKDNGADGKPKCHCNLKTKIGS